MAAPTYRCVVPSCDKSQSRGDKIRRANVVDPTALNALTGRSMAPNSKAALCEQHYAEHVTSRRLDRGGSGAAVAVVAAGQGVDRLAEIRSNESGELSEFSADELSMIVKAAERRRGFHDVDVMYDAILDAVIARLGEESTRQGRRLTADERTMIIGKAVMHVLPGKKDMLRTNDESGERAQRAHVHLDASVGDDDSLVTLGYFIADESESVGYRVAGRTIGTAELDALKAAHPALWESLSA
jgi:hypothetical protein